MKASGEGAAMGTELTVAEAVMVVVALAVAVVILGAV